MGNTETENQKKLGGETEGNTVEVKRDMELQDLLVKQKKEDLFAKQQPLVKMEEVERKREMEKLFKQKLRKPKTKQDRRERLQKLQHRHF